ncbi:MAG: hypothetical protein ACJ751_06380 [Niastella sp.]|uniref:hypothetical protein n=1 Tax=Niastella sp. TaxID=1869183 RepID=UPI00389A0F1B
MLKLLTISVIGWCMSAGSIAYANNIRHLNGRNEQKIACDTFPARERLRAVGISGVSNRYDVFYIGIPETNGASENVTVAQQPVENRRVPLLKITGNILYDVNYRSRIDTPYAEKNVYQHTVQTRLDLVYKERYPFKLYVTTRFSNSSLFRKYTDLNFQFNQSEFKRNIKERLWNSVQSYLASKSGKLDSLKRLIETKKKTIGNLSQSLQAPDVTQKMVEEREKELLSKRSGTGSHNQHLPVDKVDSLKERVSDVKDKIIEEAGKIDQYKDSITAKKQQLDSLRTELEAIENLYRKLKLNDELNLAAVKKQIESGNDLTALAAHLQQLNVPDTVLPKGYKTLSSLQTLSIGRSTADYTELSVRNVSITGLQVEFNPRYYYALAVGKVDYRFRDYIVPNGVRSNQYVALARFGKGMKNGNHLYLTYYTGKRQFFNASIASQAGGSIPEYKLAGVTLEGQYRLNKNITLIGEVAKSTMPYYSVDSLQRKSWMNAVSNFNERSNEAVAFNLLSYFPKTRTRFTGNLRYTGANFQSFSSFTTGASQLKWLGRLEQPLFKKQLTFVTSLQQNDYNNPFLATTYKSSSLLASIQATARIKKWPVLSAGYYPSYQLIKTGDDQYTETRYYIMTGSAGYYYNIKETQLSTYAVYSRFYNEMSDSGFVYYNSKNLLLSQNAAFGRFSLMLNASLSTSTEYDMYTLENNVQVAVSKIVSVGAGAKMIRYSLLPEKQWGYNASLTLRIPRLGDIQLMIDKGFLPGLNRQLTENRVGRLTYYKTF